MSASPKKINTDWLVAWNSVGLSLCAMKPSLILRRFRSLAVTHSLLWPRATGSSENQATWNRDKANDLNFQCRMDCVPYSWKLLSLLNLGFLSFIATRLTVDTQQTFFYELAIKYKTSKRHVFNNSLLRHLSVGLCKKAWPLTKFVYPDWLTCKNVCWVATVRHVAL